MKNNLSSALALDRRIFKFIRKYISCELKYRGNILFNLQLRIRFGYGKYSLSKRDVV